MSNETNLIMKRRFISRILESGLLIIAVALGVGAAASGLSLMFHTKDYSEDLLNSATYKEVVVTTRANLEDMDYPVIEKTPNTTVLTVSDLEAGDLIDDVLFSYVVSSSRIKLITEDSSTGNFGGPEGRSNGQETSTNNTDIQKPTTDGGVEQPAQDSPGDQQAPPEGPGGDFREQMDETLQKMKDNPDYLLSEEEELNGAQVTSQFFLAWEFEAETGSLFADSDYSSNGNPIILGSELAKKINTNNLDDLTGKKIASWGNVYTVVGVLAETGTKYDNRFLTPKKSVSNNAFMRMFGDTQLRFYVDDVTLLDSTVSQLETWFESQYGEGQVIVSNPRNEATKVVSRNSGISFLILFLSLAGLFIASVNVSNILMSRSLRMKKHVGILKALGASKNSIMMLFVKEAVLITVIGSILGTFLALPLSMTMEESLGLGEVSWFYIILGVVLSSMLTLLFSVLPARQSMNIEAAEAMRSAG
ncbi:ABC transporter permease [Thiospirochaeta perfilievii]|uniref:ABC transporter permease n=1 Tax=Thiospirochaeta perfilievii TaxID=252967 RepID=A0A5C1QB57_9SPIO|nr:FtsX-like permease family protein [Thiospirochaeta perfilievii]QEN03392.1 ABC transporter permease [Thiospirochaeta perfilievii]